MKPRNPTVPNMVKRKAGAHGKSNKAKRLKDKQEIRHIITGD